MSIANSSITSSPHKDNIYDVFLSFEAEETRHKFAVHLYVALLDRGIRTYYRERDIKNREKTILEYHKKAIEDSKLCIVVFSKKYTSSVWCLEELEKIMECHNTTGTIVFPVYYDVQPHEIQIDIQIQSEKLGKWRDTIKEATSFVGLVLNDNTHRNGSEDIKKIISEICIKLKLQDITLPIDWSHVDTSFINQNFAFSDPHANNDHIALADTSAINLILTLGDTSQCVTLDSITSSLSGELIGMKTRIKDFESFLDGFDDVRMIGIKGIGGGGKTALARAIFDRLSIQFEGVSFVENVRDISKVASSGLKLLQEKILSDVLNEKGINLKSVHDGKTKMQMWLYDKKVLVVLDDVDHRDQLEALAGDLNWFKPGSRIIITTRDEHVLLAHRVKWIYDVNLLSNKEALCLFSRHAFGKDIPNQGYKELSIEAVSYAAGLPLTIKVLGSFLCDKNELEWIDALKRLKTIPLKETLEKLELSYVSLEDDYKEIFLDVACLMKGWMKDDLIRILESCGFHARNGLRVLEQKSLLTISKDKHLGMHDHIEEMGRNIVRRLHPDEPNRHSRLWIQEEIEDILGNDLDTAAARAIVVDSPVKLNSEIVTKGFGKMKKLRLLYVVSDIDDECEIKVDQANPNFPNALRFLSWVGYPRWSLPRTFQANNLVALEMPYSRIAQLWDGGERKVLNKLRFLNLRHSLLNSLDLGLTPNLERLDLEDCYNLVELGTPVGCAKLVFLNVSGCLKINSFLFLEQLKSIEVLCLNRLYLTKFPDIILGHCNNSLLQLRFRYNNIEELPSSIGNLQNLLYLDLHSCIKLKSLPRSICGLLNLRNLKLNGCMLEELPPDIGHLECLEKLNLSFTRIKHLPDSFCMLKHLKTLNLSSCWSLEKLPDNLDRLECLQNLILTECTRIRYIPDNICELRKLKYLSVLGCIQIEELPKQIGFLECLEVLNLKGTRIRVLPRSISLLKDLKIYGPKTGLLLRDSLTTSGKKQKIDLNQSFLEEQQ